MLYALASVLLSLALVIELAPLAGSWLHAALLALVGLTAAFTAGCYSAKLVGLEPEGLLDRGGPVTHRLVALLLAPYSLLALLAIRLQQLVSREPLADPVAPSLWIGSVPLPGDRGALTARGITAVLDLCFEFGDLAGCQRAGLEHFRVPMLDSTAPSLERLDRAVAWCQARLDAGATVFIHCAHGHGRSALVAAATLLARGLAASPEEALERIRAARPGVNLSTRQTATLSRVVAIVPADDAA